MKKEKKNNFGFTLIETMVVVAITAIMAVSVSTNVMSFQKDAKLDAFTREFASNLESARNKSINSETPPGSTGFEDYSETDTLPFWVVSVSGDHYSYYSKYKLFSDPGYTESTPETSIIPSGYSISPQIEVDFERLTGKTNPASFTITIPGYLRTETVNVDSQGIIKIIK